MSHKNDRATDEDVMSFITAIAPQAPNLYLAAFSEKKALNDAVELIADLRKRIEKLEAVRNAAVNAVGGELDFHLPTLGQINRLRKALKEAE